MILVIYRVLVIGTVLSLGTLSFMAIERWWNRRRRARVVPTSPVVEEDLDPSDAVDARTPDLLRSTAVHEAGHAVVAWACMAVHSIDAVKVTVDGNGAVTGGYVSRNTFEAFDAIERLWCSAVICLGGVAAELMEFGKSRSGPARFDFIAARECATQLVKLGKRTPPWATSYAHPGVLPFETIYHTPLLEKEREVLDHAHRMAHQLVLAHRTKHSKLVDALVRKHTMNEDDVRETLGLRPFIILNFMVHIIRGRGAGGLFYLPPQDSASQEAA